MKGKEFKDLYVKDGKILPNDVNVIEDYLYLGYNKISKIENLPKVIKGSLFLHNNNISKIENLPKIIGGNLCLVDNPIWEQYLKSNFKDEKEWAYTVQRLNRWAKE